MKNAALLIVYTFIIFLISSVLFFTQSLRHEAALILSESPEIIVQRTISGRFDPVPLQYSEKIAGIRGVISVLPRLWGYYYDDFYKANYTVIVPEKKSPADGEIDIGYGVARQLNLKTGDLTTLNAIDGLPQGFIIRKILPSESQLVSSDMILMSENDYRTLTGLKKDVVTDLVLSVRNPLEYSTVARKIKEIYPDTRPILRNEILRTYDAVFSWRSGLLMFILLISISAFLIFSWDRASGLSADERKEIGILKATGWETSDILKLKSWEGLIVSITAFITGTVLGYIHVYYLSSSLFLLILKGWSTLYPQFRLMPYVRFSDIITLFMLSVIPYTAAIIIPSWRASTIDPDSVMR